MANPWERYQTRPNEAQNGPWTRYSGQTAAMVKANPEQRESASLTDRIGAAGSGLLQGGTLGAADYLEAGLASLIPIDRMVATDGSADIRFGQFKNNLEEVRKRDQKQKEAAPLTYLGGEIGGSIAGIGKLAKAGGTATRFVPQGLKGGKGFLASSAALGVDGAAIGGADALLNDRSFLGQSATGGIMGAGLNAATLGAGRVFQPFLRGAIEKLPKSDQLFDQASNFYRQAGNSGTRYSPEQLRALQQGVMDELPEAGIGGVRQATDPNAYSAIKQITETVEQGASISALDDFRKSLSTSATANPRDQHLVGKIRTNLDEFMEGMTPAEQTTDGLSALRAGRATSRQAQNSQRVESLLEEATDNASGTLSGRLKKAEDVRRQFKNMLKKDEMKYFTKEQQDFIRDKIVRGGNTDTALRLLGKAAPTGYISGAGGFGALSAFGGAGAAIPVGGALAKIIADRRTMDGVEELLARIRSGKNVAPRKQGNLQRILDDQKTKEDLSRALLAAGVVTQ